MSITMTLDGAGPFSAPTDINLPTTPGIHVLNGPHGSGKSTVLATFGHMLTPDRESPPVSKTRGRSAPGKVTVAIQGTGPEGSIVLTLGGRSTITGDLSALPVRLGVHEGSRFADLIGPEDIRDSQTPGAKKARVRALLGIAGIQVTPEICARLASNQQISLTGWKSPGDLGDVAAEIKTRLNAARLATDKDVSALRGGVDTLRAQIRPYTGNPRPVATLDALEREAQAVMFRHQASAEARHKAEQERERIKASMPPAPTWEDICIKVEALNNLIATTKCVSDTIAIVAEFADDLTRRTANLARVAAAHEAAHATLATAPTGSSWEEVEYADAQLSVIRSELAQARIVEANAGIEAQLAPKQKAYTEAAARQAALTAAADRVDTVRAELIREAGLTCLTIGDSGDVVELVGGKEVPFAERSFSQRFQAALETAAASIKPDDGKTLVMTLSPVLWTSLTTEAMRESGDIAARSGFCIYTSGPSDVPGIDIESFGATS